MKKFFITLGLVILVEGILPAQMDTLSVNSKITAVTVFLQGAEVRREVQVNAPKGRHILQIDALPQSLDPNRIQALRFDGLEILSVNSQIRNPKNHQADSRKKALQKNIKDIEDQIRVVREKRSVLSVQEKVLMENVNFQGENAGASVDQIRQAADFYNERLGSLIDLRLALDVQTRALQDDLKSVYQELNRLQNMSILPETVVLITVECERQVSGKMQLQYFVELAGWKPSYDFRVEETDQPLSVVYNGNVFQNSGEDWKNVKLTLSSANPNISSTAPKLETWYINRGEPAAYKPVSGGSGGVEGRISDADSGEPLPFVSLAVTQNGSVVSGSTTDADGRFSIKPLPSGGYQVNVNYVGYDPMTYSLNIRDKEMEYLDVRMKSGMMLEEVQIVEYSVPLIEKDGGSSGSAVRRDEINRIPGRSTKSRAVQARGGRGINEVMYINGMKFDGVQGISMKMTPTDIAYAIDLPFTIPSDGRDHLISIKEAQAPAKYLYKSVPKLDKDAFLVARLPDWSDLNLLSGNTSIYFKGAFKGQAFLDADLAVDTLEISLGRDQSIVVERKANKEIDDKRFLGNKTRQTVGWDITVRNNKNSPINIEVFDQFPLSELESIEVERINSAGAQLDEKTGELKWTLEIPASKSEKVAFSYGVKYPTGAIVIR